MKPKEIPAVADNQIDLDVLKNSHCDIQTVNPSSHHDVDATTQHVTHSGIISHINPTKETAPGKGLDFLMNNIQTCQDIQMGDTFDLNRHIEANMEGLLVKHSNTHATQSPENSDDGNCLDIVEKGDHDIEMTDLHDHTDVDVTVQHIKPSGSINPPEPTK